ncbi:MAG: hypothetical protein ACJAYU_002424 [Bradymonadia bacterium]|jgi:hypothetical protein
MDQLFQLTRIDPVTGIAEPIPAKERVDAIISHPQTKEIIRSLDHQALYGLIHEAGVNDALELVLLASTDQVQAIIDFDCWTRDEFELQRYSTWLEVLLQREDVEFAEWIDQMDPEPLVLWIREQVAIFQWELDLDVLDTIDDPVSTSPDGVYALVIPEDDGTTSQLLRHMLDRLYQISILTGHRFLEAARWELSSDLMETGYRLREGRLGDLGFVPFHEALEVFAFLNPPSWAADVRARAADPETEPLTFSEAGKLPPVDHQIQVLETKRFAEQSSFFTRAMGSLPSAFESKQLEAVVDSVLTQFRALVNRVHVAAMGNPGDTDAGRMAADRTDNYLSIALELAAGDNALVAARIVGIEPLKRIHQAGYSATARIAKQARQLVKRGNLSLVDGSLSLLDENDQDLFDGLLTKRPCLSGTYDTPFRSIADIESVALRLGEVAFVELIMFGTFRHTKDELAAMVFDETRNASPVVSVTFRVLFATRVLGELLKPGRELAPLPLDQLHKVVASFRGNKGDAHSKLTSTGIRLVSGRGLDDPRLAGLATAYSARIAGWILDEFGDLTRPVATEIAEQVVLLAP